jgi:hypothetical protein
MTDGVKTDRCRVYLSPLMLLMFAINAVCFLTGSTGSIFDGITGFTLR